MYMQFFVNSMLYCYKDFYYKLSELQFAFLLYKYQLLHQNTYFLVSLGKNSLDVFSLSSVSLICELCYKT